MPAAGLLAARLSGDVTRRRWDEFGLVPYVGPTQTGRLQPSWMLPGSTSAGQDKSCTSPMGKAEVPAQA